MHSCHFPTQFHKDLKQHDELTSFDYSIPSMLPKEQKSPKAPHCSPVMWAKCL